MHRGEYFPKLLGKSCLCTIDWILIKKAKRSNGMTSAVKVADEFIVKAMSGTVTTSCI